MKKLIILMMLSLVMLSGCRLTNEDNIYYDSKDLTYGLIVLSKETGLSTKEFTYISDDIANWEWEDSYIKFEDSTGNTYVVKIYYNDLDYKITIESDVLVDTMTDKESDFK